MQTYDDLLRERDALLLRVEQLSEENRQLRLQLAQHTPAKPTQDEPNSHFATSLFLYAPNRRIHCRTSH